MFDFGFNSTFAVPKQGNDYWLRTAFPLVTSLTLWVLTVIGISTCRILKNNKYENEKVYQKTN
jgi:hypothetical protein